MSKTWLIIKREFSTRVRKRSFIVMTILGPVLSAALFILPAYLATLPQDYRTILVLDEPGLMNFDKGKDEVAFRYLPPKKYDLEAAKEFFKKEEDYAFLHIPLRAGGDPDFIARNTVLYSKGDVNPGIENYIEDKLEKYIQNEKLKALGVEPEVMARTKTSVNIKSYNLEDGTQTEGLALVKMGIGYVAGFMIYLFVFIYGAQVMRGVIEEKTTRIVEVMISSVKPFQLMLGKILGLAGVALLQFLIWVMFGALFYFLAFTFILEDQLDAANIASGVAAPNNDIIEIFKVIEAINFPYLIACFLFYFLFGYLLYAAMFAAIGSAVDKESDTQQFMFPVSLPLIAAIIVLIRALDDPNGSIATWFSMIPFTSPIVMMARVPFNIPWYELLTSMLILAGSFLIMTWLAARIYRTGILMYGKKPKLKEIIKWIRYKA